MKFIIYNPFTDAKTSLSCAPSTTSLSSFPSRLRYFFDITCLNRPTPNFPSIILSDYFPLPSFSTTGFSVASKSGATNTTAVVRLF
jgi:hypothetical protein